MTAQQIAWARSHDWFVMALPDNRVVVLDRWFNCNTGKSGEDRLVFADFRKLRAWAGY